MTRKSSKLLFRLEERLGLFTKSRGFVDQFLGLLTAVPEGLSRHERVEFAQAFLRARDVKETSACGPVYRYTVSVDL